MDLPKHHAEWMGSTHACSFDDALGGWIIVTPETPDPTGKCWFWEMDRGLIMYLLKRLFVGRHGVKHLNDGIDVASREARLRYRMRAAKKRTDTVHAMRQKLRKIDLYWESIASTWLIVLSQTCKAWRLRVREFRENVGVGYMIDDAAHLQRVLFAEKKFIERVRVCEHVNTTHAIIKEVGERMRLRDNVPAMLKNGQITRRYDIDMPISNTCPWSLLDVWNSGGKKAFKKLTGFLMQDVNRVVETHTCQVKISFSPKGKQVRFCEKTCVITAWLVEAPAWLVGQRRRNALLWNAM
jgi:hypothetical protein